MRLFFLPFLLVTFASFLSGCAQTSAPDYRIRVMPNANGTKTTAVPPECADWATVANTPFENQTSPQYGCATARNLAAQVADPHDLMEGRTLGNADATVSAATIHDYRAGKTAPLIDAKKGEPVQTTATGSGQTP